jgi:hypothetical protein
MRAVLPAALAATLVLSTGALAASSHKTLHERFVAANTTHDGHLTLEQAKAGMKSIAKKWDAIDKDHQGYVTEDDIHAYYKARRHHPAAETQKS